MYSSSAVPPQFCELAFLSTLDRPRLRFDPFVSVIPTMSQSHQQDLKKWVEGLSLASASSPKTVDSILERLASSDKPIDELKADSGLTRHVYVSCVRQV